MAIKPYGGYSRLSGPLIGGLRELNSTYYQKMFRNGLKDRYLNRLALTTDTLASVLGSSSRADLITSSLIKIRAIQARYLKENPDATETLLKRIDEARGKLFDDKV